MAFFDDVMTVYNYRLENGEERWNRSVVRGVQWRHGKRRVTADKGVFTDEAEESITVDLPGHIKGIHFMYRQRNMRPLRIRAVPGH